MGFLDDLLTGRGPSLETRSLSTISPEQRAALNALIAQMQGAKPSVFGGQLSAGLSPFERSSLTALEQRSQALAQPDPTLQAAGGAVRSLTDFEDQTGDASRFFQTNVQDPLLQSFQREILPQISRQFGGANFFSTERQAAEGLAREDLLETLAGRKTAVELDQFNQARQRALQAAGLAPGLAEAERGRTQSQIDILKAAGIEREVGQQGLDRNYAEFVRQQAQQQQQQQLLSQLGLTPTIENIGMTDPGNAGLLSTLLGALASGAGGSLGQGLGQGLGRGATDLLGRILGRGGPNVPTPSVGSGPTPLGPILDAGISGGIAGTLASGARDLARLPMPTLPASGVPGGTATIFEGAGLDQLANQIGSTGAAIGGGGGLAGLIRGIQPGIAGGVAATEAANATALANFPAPAGVGGSLGGGAGADAAARAAGAPTGSGAAIARGVGTALATVGALYGAYSTVQAARAGDTRSAALSGAATGAAIGSIVPVIGTAVGAVIGGLVGAVGSLFGDSERPSERAYGAHKKLPGEATVRNWTQDQVFGAQFETIKSHTKSGNINRFKDVAEMFSAFGITRDAHKNIKNMQTQMNEFIKGVITTAQGTGGLPTDPTELAKLDGQQIYYKLVVPAMAAKVEETIGRPAASNAWSNITASSGSAMHALFADATDWMISTGAAKSPAAAPPRVTIPRTPPRGMRTL